MSSIKGFIDWVKGEDMEDDFDDLTPMDKSETKTSSGATSSSPMPEAMDSASRRSNKVVNINATTQLAVVLVKPDRFENASEIADHLKDKKTVVLNLEQTNKDIARRLVDFLCGVAYAQEGKIKKIANSTYIITPYNVNIIGDLIDELENNGMYF